MNSTNTPTEHLMEDLVAFLDGELDAAQSQALENRLATDPDLRRELQHLERTWDALDGLERATVKEDFTQTTVEMVAHAAEADLQRTQALIPARKRRRWLMLGGVLAGAVALSFLIIWALLPNPNRELLQNLTVLEHLDEYRTIEHIEFLRQLHKQNLFPAKPPAAETDEAEEEQGSAASSASVPKGYQARSTYVTEMNQPDREQLQRNWDWFQSNPQEAKQLQELSEQIENDPDSAALQATAERYYAWFEQLPYSEQLTLLELPLEPRLEQVSRKRRLDRVVELFTERDFEQLARTLAVLPARGDAERIQRILQQDFSSPRMQYFMLRFLERFVDGAQKRPNSQFSPERIASLFEKTLAVATFVELKKLIEESENPLATLREFAEALADQRSRDFKRKLGNSIDDYAAFIENDLEPAERLRIESLPPEEFMDELQEAMHQQRSPQGFPWVRTDSRDDDQDTKLPFRPGPGFNPGDRGRRPRMNLGESFRSRFQDRVSPDEDQ